MKCIIRLKSLQPFHFHSLSLVQEKNKPIGGKENECKESAYQHLKAVCQKWEGAYRPSDQTSGRIHQKVWLGATYRGRQR